MKKPNWLKIRPPKNIQNYQQIKSDLSKLGLNTVCQEAKCPNMAECWSGGTATFMIMGDICTRGCKFCNIKTGLPKELNKLEPEQIAFACKKMKLDYVVITSVDRDELEDQGANHFARTIEVVKKINPEILVEVLIPDFRGKFELINKIINANPDVIAHNIETTQKLQKKIRDFRASYQQSLKVLEYIKSTKPQIHTKSSIMVGLGETPKEVVETMQDLKNTGVSIFTLGQYLKPSKKHLDVEKYISLEQFKWYKEQGEKIGFIYVASGPFVRSSYKAGELFTKALINEQNALKT